MRLIFHGAAREIGRSSIELESEGYRYLFDLGIKFLSDGFAYPKEVFKISDLDGVFISHAHLDHTGALPLFEHYNLKCPIFMTAQTKPIIKVLLKDSYKIARIKNLHPAYNKIDLKKVNKAIKIVDFNKEYNFKNLKFYFYNAGHIPGSASIVVEVENKRILYTGDINTRKTLLMKPLNNRDFNNIDIMITEATYGDRFLPERKNLYNDFLNSIEDVINKGGTVIIPTFALGRAQELLIMLSKREWKVPIYFDGMAKQITRKILTNNSSFVINKDKLHNMFFNKVKFVSTNEHRDKIMKKQSIIITTSGMVQGGPVLYYLKELWHDPKNAIFLVGYQVRHTNGWLLENYGEFYINGWKTKFKGLIKKFEFSGHLDKNDLHQLILDVKPKLLVIQHGNEESVLALKKWVEENTNINVIAPNIGDKIKIT